MTTDQQLQKRIKTLEEAVPITAEWRERALAAEASNAVLMAANERLGKHIATKKEMFIATMCMLIEWLKADPDNIYLLPHDDVAALRLLLQKRSSYTHTTETSA